MVRRKSSLSVLVSTILLGGVVALAPVSPAQAVVTDTAPLQSQCDSGGSTTYTWGDGALTAVTRPVVASMTVNGEAVPFGQIAAPNDHKLGVAICSNMSDARKVGFSVIHREGSSYTMGLAGAQTPLGATVDENTVISFTLTNLGTLAQYYSFSLVHGIVSDWTTANLGTGSASLTVTMKPARTPLVDFSIPAAQFCSATPPVCDAASSGMDILSASFDMDFDQAGNFADFRGSYFALEGAVSGFVTPQQNDDGTRSISAKLGGPHTLADTVTPNVGSMQAFLPTAVLSGLLGVDAASLSESDLSVRREEGGDSSSAPFSVTSVAGGAIISVSDITFSTPEYTIQSGSGAGSYRLFSSDGGVFNYGDDTLVGSAAGSRLAKPIVGAAATSDRDGYWLVSSDGGVFNYGDAGFFNSMGGKRLAAPIVGITPTPTDQGYWLVAADGGVFAFGDARFYESMGGKRLNAPIVGITATSTGNGYWLVASDGGVFAFGDALFKGSAGSTRINKPVVGIASTSDDGGYWLVASDGGIFNYGSADFHGSAGAIRLNKPVVGMTAMSNDAGYWLVASDGGVFNYGAAEHAGSAAGIKLAAPIVAID